MTYLEFAVIGIPRSPRAGTREKWQNEVSTAAQKRLPNDWVILARPVSGVIVYFHRGEASGVDVDNMSKPILDAIEGIVFIDDQQVEQLTARRTNLSGGLKLRDVSSILTSALEQETDFVLVRIGSPPNHEVLPA